LSNKHISIGRIRVTQRPGILQRDACTHYYNHDRMELKLKGLSPVQYRTQALAA